ncbi:hypothetical protein D3C87_1059850 [compost metagenome]
MFRRHQQVDVAEHAAARLVEHKIAQGLIASDESALFPDRFTRWRPDATDDHIPHLAFRMGGDDVNGLDTAH